MTYSHGIQIKPASASGGISITVGDPFQFSEKDPEPAFRDLVEANSHPRGAILERVDGRGIREALGLGPKEGIIVRTRVSEGKASYMLLLPSPFPERSTK